MLYALTTEDPELDPIELQQEEAELGIFPTTEDRRILLTRLKLLGAKHVAIEFQGGGDSGEIHTVYIVDSNDQQINIDNELIRGWKMKSEFNHDKKDWDKSLEYIENMKLADLLENLTYDALEKSGEDWYNNDGGQGSFTIDFTQSPPDIQLELGINYTETTEHLFNL